MKVKLLRRIYLLLSNCLAGIQLKRFQLLLKIVITIGFLTSDAEDTIPCARPTVYIFIFPFRLLAPLDKASS
ncbi:hypothetical protein F5B18DRAFT_641654 [Nemania serpens]|nr:hypothetical protein F5B18DRAFT_641654 [Nemania serpens]